MSADGTFPAVPQELKFLAPFLQRAQELKVKDPIMAYWCMYYVAKQGISSKSQSKESRPFLYQIMSILEEMKASLGNNEAMTDDDVGTAYIENFALRVFTMADNEDRKGEATRPTAKKFLAAANFFELLHIFDKPVDADISEKIRYSKWKAADIAKAFREGRKPTPGDAHAMGDTLLPPQADGLSAWSPGTSLEPSPAVGQGLSSLTASPTKGADVPLPTELPSTPPRPAWGGQLHLQAHDNGYVTPGMWSTMATPGVEDIGEGSGGIGESPSVRAAARRAIGGRDDDAWSTAENPATSRQGSWTAVEGAPLVPPGSLPLDGGLGLQGGGAPLPPKKVHFSPSVVGGLSSTASSVVNTSPPGSPERFEPSLPTVQEGSDKSPPHVDPTVLPLPESGSSMDGSPPIVQKIPSPTAPQSPNVFASKQFPAAPHQHVGASPQFPSVQPQFPSAPPQFPSTPPQFPAAPPQVPGGLPAIHLQAPGGLPTPPPPPIQHHAPRANNHRAPPLPSPQRSPSPPPELTPTQITRIQKHCKFAISALDYEDAHTARKELQAALEMLGK